MYLILSILIAMGEHYPKTESEIRFGWGISYNYIGQLYHNLNKYDVVVGMEIPDFRTVWHTTLHSQLILNIVRGGMILSLGYCIKLVLKFGQLI